MKRVFLVLAALACGTPEPVRAHPASEERLKHLNALIEADPRVAQHYVSRAFEHLAKRNFTEALADLETASRMEPVPLRLEVFRAQVQCASGAHETCLAAAAGYLQNHPTDAQALLLSAQALAALRRSGEVHPAYVRALDRLEQEARPGPDLYAEAAQATEQTGDLRLSLAWIERGLEHLGSIPSLEELALEYERRLGRSEAALERIERLMARSARKERWWVARAEVLEQLGRRPEALEAYRQAASALETLPHSRRHTVQTAELDQKVQAGLLRLSSVPAQKRPATALQEPAPR